MTDPGSIIQIDDILVSGEIINERFCCDYETCKGACCIYGDSGAPMTLEEAEEIERNLPHFESLLSEGGKASIRKNGFFTIDCDGDVVTPLVEGTEECAYTYFDEHENCMCAIERRFCQGCGTFRKPISCSLYPIRVTQLSSGLTALNLHRWDICRCAFEKGRREGVRVYEFLREPLTRAFGEDFYEALDEVAKEM